MVTFISLFQTDFDTFLAVVDAARNWHKPGIKVTTSLECQKDKDGAVVYGYRIFPKGASASSLMKPTF